MRDIGTLHPFLRLKAEELKTAVKRELNLDIIITECLRTNDEQKALYAQGRKTLEEVNALRAKASWGKITAAQNKFTVTDAPTAADSMHGYGIAFDIAVVDPTGKIIEWKRSDWNKDGKDDWLQVGEIGVRLGLEWGGQWTSRVDMPHYQYTFGKTLRTLKAEFKPGVTANIPYSLQATAVA